MATLTRYWRLDSTTGGDGTEDRTDGGTRAYESLEALVTAEATNLDTANNILHAICTQPGQESPSATLELNGFTTSAADYLIVECQGDARHNGVSRESSSAGYQMKRAGDAMRGGTAYYRLKGIEFCTSGESYSPFEDLSNPGAANSDWRFDECLFTCTSATVKTTYTFDISTGCTATVTNCLAIAKGHRGFDFRSGTITVNHFGIVTNSTYGFLGTNTGSLSNSYCLGATTQDFYTGGTAPSGSHNASLDNSAATDYTNTVDVVAGANEFTNYSADPATTDLTLKDSLLNAAGTGSEPIDIAGTTRTGTADIGPFEWAAAGSDLDITATLVNIAVADLLATMNTSRNLTATLVDIAVADILAALNNTRDLTGTLVDVAIADVDATGNNTRNLTATLVDAAVADIDATVGLGGSLDLTATLVDVVVADILASVNLSHLLTATLVDVPVADVDATVALDANLTATLVDIAVADLLANLNLSRDLIATLVDVAIADIDATTAYDANLVATLVDVVVADLNATVELAGSEGEVAIQVRRALLGMIGRGGRR